MIARRAVSLFSNCGAGDIGYRNAGFRFDVMAELDPRRLEVCLLNHPGAVGVPGDLRETWPTVVENYREKAGNERPVLLAACPPCQGMSSARGDRGQDNDPDAGMRDIRNLLAVVIANVALQLMPSVIVVENVPAFLTRKVRHPDTQQPISAAALLTSMLEDNYLVYPFLADLCDYGVPQSRKRTFLTFLRKDLSITEQLFEAKKAPFPNPTHVPGSNTQPITLRAAIQEWALPSLDARSEETATSDIGTGLHFVPVWPEERYAMVAAIPADSGASAWENNYCSNCGEVDVDIETLLCPHCQVPLLRPNVLDEDGTYRFIKGFRTSSYRRMHPDEPAATITTASGHLGSHSTIHPSENRVFSPLECAYLQTFPKDFKWGNALQKWGHTNIRQMIGEAVPPHFTLQHGQVLKQLLQGTVPSNAIHLDDPRCKAARRKLELVLQPNLPNI